jgi:hypothetical protein
MSYQEITKQDLEKTLEKLYQNYAKLLANIQFKGDFECICGMISEQITKFLREQLGIQANYMSGNYYGRGTEFSGGKSGTSHCWVELWLKLKEENPDGIGDRELKVIIDGAYAQFFPFELTPKATKDRQRLMVFITDKTAEEWYKGSVDNWRWKDAK